MINLINGDCMDYLVKYKDNEVDLAIVDPPYGIGNIIRHGKGNKQKANNLHFDNGNHLMDWNNKIPSKEYFIELQRVSKNQIIWGGNYYANYLENSRCWVVWDKKNSGSFADVELAWTSFDKVALLFSYRWNGMIQQNMKNKEVRIHPTQKPVALYRWLLENYATPGDTIIDTHLGSGSIAIACHDYGYDLTGIEKDKEYFEAAKKRLEEHQMQLSLF